MCFVKFQSDWPDLATFSLNLVKILCTPLAYPLKYRACAPRWADTTSELCEKFLSNRQYDYHGHACTACDSYTFVK